MNTEEARWVLDDIAADLRREFSETFVARHLNRTNAGAGVADCGVETRSR